MIFLLLHLLFTWRMFSYFLIIIYFLFFVILHTSYILQSYIFCNRICASHYVFEHLFLNPVIIYLTIQLTLNYVINTDFLIIWYKLIYKYWDVVTLPVFYCVLPHTLNRDKNDNIKSLPAYNVHIKSISNCVLSVRNKTGPP